MHVGIIQRIEVITLFLKSFPLVFQTLYCDGEALVVLVYPLVLVLDALDLEAQLLDICDSGVVHSLLGGVFPNEFFYVDGDLLQVDLQDIDFLSEVDNAILINLTFDSKYRKKYLCSFSARSLSCCSS